MSTNLTDANIGSAVRWIVTNLGGVAVTYGVGTNELWTAAAGALASLAMLAWSAWANKKKTA